MISRFLLRLVLVPFGAAAALAVATAVVFVANRDVLDVLRDADRSTADILAVLLGAHLLAVLVSTWGAFSFAPAAAGVLIAEVFAIRSWIFHAGNGGLSAWLGYAMTRDMTRGAGPHLDLGAARVVVAAGLAAGFAYWLIAGATAGFWKPIRRRARS